METKRPDIAIPSDKVIQSWSLLLYGRDYMPKDAAVSVAFLLAYTLIFDPTLYFK